jgi:hypothetical protein
MLPYLRPLSPNNPESAIPKTRERNNLYARESTYHDYDLQEAEHAETSRLEFVPGYTPFVNLHAGIVTNQGIVTIAPKPLQYQYQFRQDTTKATSIARPLSDKPKKVRNRTYQPGDVCASIDPNNRPSTPQPTQYLLQHAKRRTTQVGHGWVVCYNCDRAP